MKENKEGNKGEGKCKGIEAREKRKQQKKLKGREGR